MTNDNSCVTMREVEVLLVKNKINLTAITLWVNRLIAGVLAVLLVTLPEILDWYNHYRKLYPNERVALMAAFYCCAVVIAIALWNMDALLRCILKEECHTISVRCVLEIILLSRDPRYMLHYLVSGKPLSLSLYI